MAKRSKSETKTVDTDMAEVRLYRADAASTKPGELRAAVHCGDVHADYVVADTRAGVAAAFDALVNKALTDSGYLP